MSDNSYRVAVIGGGPRGLAALEYLYEALLLHCSPFTVKTVLFEPTRFPGSGPVYAPDQATENWLNIPQRLVNIEARPGLSGKFGEIRGFPSYHSWAENEGIGIGETRVDHYPQRAKLGKYLTARFDSLAESLVERGWLTIISSHAERIDFEDGCVTIATVDGQRTKVDEVVMTIGHQPVEPDDSMQRWRTYTQNKPQITLLSDPYPTLYFVQHQAIDPQSTVAIRGFGLAMIDVVKALTEARGGRFVIVDEQARTMHYTPSGNEPHRIVPFSLNGLPLVPKPLNAAMDGLFDPAPELKKAFEVECMRIATSRSNVADPLHDLIEMVSSIQVSQFLTLDSHAVVHSLTPEQLMSIARQWLSDAEFQHDLIVSKELPVEAAMRTFLRMACELAPCSFDYCQGQVWRHLQSILFRCLSHTSLPPESIGDIARLHERMKRYSYGPPVDAMQRLVALNQSALLSFAVIDDPDIELTPNGWVFEVEQTSLSASVMIDSVLASPDFEKVSSTLIRQLRKDRLVLAFADSLGALTGSDGQVLDALSESPVPLAILGRLAKGPLIGVDSLVECFGEHQRRWAESLVRRLSDRS